MEPAQHRKKLLLLFVQQTGMGNVDQGGHSPIIRYPAVDLEELFASLQDFPISPPAARLAGELKRDYARKGATLNLGDVIIAAVAIHYELTLLTDNVKDFPMEDLLLYPLPNPS
jgi:hypothetical protein